MVPIKKHEQEDEEKAEETQGNMALEPPKKDKMVEEISIE